LTAVRSASSGPSISLVTRWRAALPRRLRSIRVAGVRRGRGASLSFAF
jgi:hypothetical protein